ncbi:MAG: response regulator [Chthoniobacterales bacterium]
MIDNEDLKWLASHATELNRLVQQMSRYSEQVRQHQGEARFLDLLNDRVDLASRKSQELFDRVTSRILVGANSAVPVDQMATNRVAAFSTTGHTNVVVKIPVGEIGAPANDLGESTIQNPKGKRELIMVVDDNEELLEQTGGMLAFEDYRVVLAKDGPEALRTYRRMGPAIALIILDYFLPVMDGDAVFDELKAIDSDVQVVLSSGFGEQAKLGSMLARGLCGFLPKPYTHERLIQQIRSILDA